MHFMREEFNGLILYFVSNTSLELDLQFEEECEYDF